MRIALLTSDHIRHKYFASVLQKKHNLRLVVAEEKGNQFQFEGKTQEETNILKSHFESLEQEQVKFFGNISYFPESISETMFVQRGGINSPTVVRKIRDRNVDGIAVFGCGILHEQIFELCPGNVVNAHQGLSPYYRGSGTNFWPFVNKELQYVGVTIHYIDAGIDTGGIICHGRPHIEQGDSMHKIGCKTIRVSAELVSTVFEEIDEGRQPAGISQWVKGRLYQRKDFNDRAVLHARKNMEEEMVDEYVAKTKNGTQPKVQLIELR